MHITRIELKNFRNHTHLELKEIGCVLIISGNNAAGKTNIVEALQLLSMHESFRHPDVEELINKKNSIEQASVSADIKQEENVYIKEVIFYEGKSKYFYNKKARPSKEIIDILPSVHLLKL